MVKGTGGKAVKRLLNTLYVTSHNRYLSLDGENIVVLEKEKEVAIQLYSVRDLVKDGSNLDQILKDLADMGYTSVEAANYNDGKFYGKTPQEFKQMVEKSGMTVLSSHTTHGLSDEELASGDFTEALKWWDQCIAAHKEAGMEYIVTPYLSVPTSL